MFLHLLTILALAVFASVPAYAQAPETVTVGTLIGGEGTVSLIAPGTESRTLTANTPIHMHDIIETGPESRALIVLIDNTEITLGENAQFTIDEYIFDEENAAASKAAYSIPHGAFLYTSGLVAKKKDPDVTVNTPFAAIGIHGTTFWGGEIDGAYGILVTDGQVSVLSGRGRITVDKGNGTALTAKTDIPARTAAWEPEKIERAVATVTMKDAEALRARVAQNAETQKIQRAKYKEYLAKRREEKKLRNDMRTPSTRIEYTPKATPKTEPPPSPAKRELNKQLQQPPKESKDQGAKAAPATVPTVDLPAMGTTDAPQATPPQNKPAPRQPVTRRPPNPATDSNARSKAAGAL